MDETHPEIVSSITETGLLTDDNRIALDELKRIYSYLPCGN